MRDVGAQAVGRPLHQREGQRTRRLRDRGATPSRATPPSTRRRRQRRSLDGSIRRRPTSGSRSRCPARSRTISGCVPARIVTSPRSCGRSSRSASAVGPVQLQLPPSFGPESLDQLRTFVTGLPTSYRWVVELRHRCVLRRRTGTPRGRRRAAVGRCGPSRPRHATAVCLRPADTDAAIEERQDQAAAAGRDRCDGGRARRAGDRRQRHRHRDERPRGVDRSGGRMVAGGQATVRVRPSTRQRPLPRAGPPLPRAGHRTSPRARAAARVRATADTPSGPDQTSLF